MTVKCDELHKKRLILSDERYDIKRMDRKLKEYGDELYALNKKDNQLFSSIADMFPNDKISVMAKQSNLQAQKSYVHFRETIYDKQQNLKTRKRKIDEEDGAYIKEIKRINQEEEGKKQ